LKTSPTSRIRGSETIASYILAGALLVSLIMLIIAGAALAFRGLASDRVRTWAGENILWIFIAAAVHVPKLAKPAGSDDALEPVAILGNLVKAGILRYLRAHPNVTVGPICDALQLGPTTVQPRLNELEIAGLVVADPPMGEGGHAAAYG